MFIGDLCNEAQQQATPSKNGPTTYYYNTPNNKRKTTTTENGKASTTTTTATVDDAHGGSGSTTGGGAAIYGHINLVAEEDDLSVADGCSPLPPAAAATAGQLMIDPLCVVSKKDRNKFCGSLPNHLDNADDEHISAGKYIYVEKERVKQLRLR